MIILDAYQNVYIERYSVIKSSTERTMSFNGSFLRFVIYDYQNQINSFMLIYKKKWKEISNAGFAFAVVHCLGASHFLVSQSYSHGHTMPQKLAVHFSLIKVIFHILRNKVFSIHCSVYFLVSHITAWLCCMAKGLFLSFDKNVLAEAKSSHLVFYRGLESCNKVGPILRLSALLFNVFRFLFPSKPLHIKINNRVSNRCEYISLTCTYCLISGFRALHLNTSFSLSSLLESWLISRQILKQP